VATNAADTGDVTLGEGASVWYGASVRGDDAPIVLGPRSNVQDGAVLHADPDAPNVIGADVTIGHGAICHGVTVEDGALIGMGAILLGGSVVGECAIVAAGALVPEGFHVPPFSLVVGVPARVRRSFDPETRRREAVEHAASYVEQALRHARPGGWVRPTSR
jgi:carbonic anhydrase/acetyltransferase-like protein (isoleucine patch superfamily)